MTNPELEIAQGEMIFEAHGKIDPGFIPINFSTDIVSMIYNECYDEGRRYVASSAGCHSDMNVRGEIPSNLMVEFSQREILHARVD